MLLLKQRVSYLDYKQRVRRLLSLKVSSVVHPQIVTCRADVVAAIIMKWRNFENCETPHYAYSSSPLE
jgi:hypothetical protein